MLLSAHIDGVEWISDLLGGRAWSFFRKGMMGDGKREYSAGRWDICESPGWIFS